MNALYQRIEEAMESQEKLQELSGCEERADGFQFDREKYKGLQEKIMEDLMRLKEQILKLEIRLTEEDMG